jgi:ABC-type oligopeptide transport system substrate-binding subunit
MPKHWWEGTDSEGRKRDISATTLEKPLARGPYRIKEFVPGRTLTLERVKDHWGRDSNTNVGRNNFDELRLEYFRDSTVALEAFKGRSGRLAHLREQRQELGRRPTTFRPSMTSACCSKSFQIAVPESCRRSL